MAVAKVFNSGNSQAVRMPKEYRFSTETVEITRQGDGVLLMPKKPEMGRFLELLRELPDDMFSDIRDERPPEERDGL